ncbi:uncharacterized protein PG998_011661 [Apiospora kogelbergensis]|uniref:uncharacterized protein n=1 Tax=Apiospora kogelbergensis TaxID=1337665 RepID=UPI00312F44EB
MAANLKEDIFMSIKSNHMANIKSGSKNHEYRKYKLPSSVRRIWFYTTAPTSAVCYIAEVSHAKEPGEVPEDHGIGNAEFNAGKKVSKYGYEILRLWKLREPIRLAKAKALGYMKGPPQKYCWVKQEVLEHYKVEDQHLLLKGTPREATPEVTRKTSPS